MVDRPTLRRVEVVNLGTQPAEPFELVRPTQMRTGGLGETGEVLGVATLQYRDRSGLIETVVGILANGLEQAIPRVAVGHLGRNEGAPHERAEMLENVGHGNRVVHEDRFGVFECRAASKHREPIKDMAFCVAEQVIRPVDRTSQSLVAFHTTASTPAQQLDTGP